MSEVDVKRAQRKVAQSKRQFEEAMNHLEGKVEDTVERVDQVKETLHKPQQAYEDLKLRAEHFKSKASDRWSSASYKVRSNPMPYALGAFVVIGSAFYGVYLGRKEDERDAVAEGLRINCS